MPCPKPVPNSYFIGKDGRNIIESVLKFATEGVETYSVLYTGRTMLSNPMKTEQNCKDVGLNGGIVKGTELKFEVYEA